VQNNDTERDDDEKMIEWREPKQQQQLMFPRDQKKEDGGVMNGSENGEMKIYETKKKMVM